MTIRARFGSTVCALVTNGLGVAVIDEFTLAAGNWPNLRALEIAEPTSFQTYIAYRKDATLSSYCEHFIASLRGHMEGRAETSSVQPTRRTTPRRASQKSRAG
jgi:DNA-binding transcriptional LysR family regulator